MEQFPEEIKALEDCTLDDLYIELGRNAASDFSPWGGDDVEAMKRRAIGWLRTKRTTLADAICGHEPLQRHCSSSSTLNLVSAAAMVLQLVKPIAIPGTAAVVSWILVREGLHRLCVERWAGKDAQPSHDSEEE